MDYKEKKRMINEKYVDAIRAIAIANDCDMGVAYDKLKYNIMDGGNYPYVNEAEARKDFEELRNIAISSAESAEEETNSAENTAE
ncbi:MAG: hypothetical protein J6B87_02815 [Clostridia bacterium]|nr:hypothetical protein [Clostridia bacterium]